MKKYYYLTMSCITFTLMPPLLALSPANTIRFRGATKLTLGGLISYFAHRSPVIRKRAAIIFHPDGTQTEKVREYHTDGILKLAGVLLATLGAYQFVNAQNIAQEQQ